MIAADEDALICDLAETYGIFNYRALPVKLLATLSAGLKPDSRVRLSMENAKRPAVEIMLAGIVDRLGHLAWMFSEDGRLGQNHPQSVLDVLLGNQTSEENSPIMAFDTPEGYESAMKEAKRGGEINGE